MPRSKNDSYLYFTRKERRGTLLLLIVVVLICLFPFLFTLYNPTIMTTPNEFDEQVTALQSEKVVATKKNKTPHEDDEGYRHYDPPAAGSYSTVAKATLFNFDPNTLTPDGWKKLGLRDKTITTIQNYLAKGGRFREATDIKKIWGLFPDEAEKLMPFVQIDKTQLAGRPVATNSPRYEKPPAKSLSPIAINEADTSAWIALPGIGSKLSQRIVNFRDRLGGFYSVQQVGETFGLPDSTFQLIKPLLNLSGEVKKINVNTATLEDLKLHPYIKYHLANAIVQYRTQHGEFKSATDLKKIMIVTEELFNKVAPYLAVE